MSRPSLRPQDLCLCRTWHPVYAWHRLCAWQLQCAHGNSSVRMATPVCAWHRVCLLCPSHAILYCPLCLILDWHGMPCALFSGTLCLILVYGTLCLVLPRLSLCCSASLHMPLCCSPSRHTTSCHSPYHHVVRRDPGTQVLNPQSTERTAPSIRRPMTVL